MSRCRRPTGPTSDNAGYSLWISSFRRNARRWLVRNSAPRAITTLAGDEGFVQPKISSRNDFLRFLP
jgi:hypothetical protein